MSPSEIPGPGKVLILRPGKLKWFLILGGMLVMIGIFIAASIGERTLWGLLPAAVCGLGAWAAGAQLFSQRVYLQLDEAGFELHALNHTYRYAWSDIQEFGVARVQAVVMVGWNHAPGYAGQEKMRALNTKLSGYQSALPDNYGQTPQALLKIMNAWLEYSRAS